MLFDITSDLQRLPAFPGCPRFDATSITPGAQKK